MNLIPWFVCFAYLMRSIANLETIPKKQQLQYTQIEYIFNIQAALCNIFELDKKKNTQAVWKNQVEITQPLLYLFLSKVVLILLKISPCFCVCSCKSLSIQSREFRGNINSLEPHCVVSDQIPCYCHRSCAPAIVLMLIFQLLQWFAGDSLVFLIAKTYLSKQKTKRNSQE